MNFEAAKRLFLDGLALLEAHDPARAEARFEASLVQLPGRVSTLANLAAARLALDRPADALAPLDDALAQAADDADLWIQRGQVLGRLGRLDEAVTSFDRALALREDHPVALYQRGMALNALHRPAAALDAFDHLLRHDAASADAHLRRGQTLQRLGRFDDALAALDAALALRPADAAACTQRGSVLAQLGRNPEAAAAFADAIRAGGDAELNGWYLASLDGTAGEAAAPHGYVQALFDDYARDFEQHLVTTLHYRGHRLIAEQLQRLVPQRRFASALDLGCGSGLCGALLRASCDRLVGVDLSSRMLDHARGRGCYDALVQADVLAHLNDAAAESLDLVVAGDVFIYLGRLEPVFAAVHRALRPGGLFAFTLESTADESIDVQAGDALRGTRSRHSQRHLLAASKASGFTVSEVLPAALRREQQHDVPGLIVCIER